MKNRFPYFTVLAMCLLAAACDHGPDAAQPEPADLLLLGGYVYAADEARNVYQALAVREGEIVYVGPDGEAQQYRGPETRVINLDGRMVIPGLHDVHIHAFGIVEPDVCSFYNEPLRLEEMVPIVQECIERYELEPGEWLTVDMWNPYEGNQPSERLPTKRAALDAASTEHPILLWGSDGHHGAVNSAALALAEDEQGRRVGLDAETLESVFAEYYDLIGVDGSGEPDGGLHEQARDLVNPPERRAADGLGALLPDIQDRLLSLGITSIQHASLTPDFLPYLAEFEASGDMRFRIQTAIRLDPLDYEDPMTGQFDVDRMMSEIEGYREQFSDSRLISATAAKIFADGVMEGNPYANPPTLGNGAVLEPYRQPRFRVDPQTGELGIEGYVDTGSELCGEVRAAMNDYRDPQRVESFTAEHGFHPRQCVISRGVLRDPEPFIHDYASRLDDAGFTVHIHVIGDRAARVAIDALESAMQGSEGNPNRHALAHLQLVHPDDQQRAGELGLYLAWTHSWSPPLLDYDMTVIPFIDEVSGPEDLYDPEGYYVQNVYPVKSMQEAGAVTAAGSDAPVDDRSPRPFVNMAGGILRKNLETGRVMNASERIGVRDMIAAYTINGARAMRQEDVVGSLEVGKAADLAVLDRNIVELYDSDNAAEIIGTEVEMTIFDGEVVYEREP